MIEIQLPCCDSATRVETLDDTLRCERCAVELDLAADDVVTAAAAA